MARIEADNLAAIADYQRQQKEWQTKKAEFDAAEARRKKLISNVFAGDVAAMEEFFGEVLADIVWPQETKASFEVADDASQIYISVDLPEIEDMPSKTASVPQRGYRLPAVAPTAEILQFPKAA